MPALDFDATFRALTGNSPFPWQQALYHDWFARGEFPDCCNLPTGLGKTSLIAVWLIALANHPGRVPRRLVYVVNRRTVVDQTTHEVERYRLKLAELLPDEPKLALSTLRGQFADNRDWSADPSRPAVICGTVDMIGSRLLFSGYGVGFKAKPLHAGFLGQDVLLVHDEAHLEPAFQQLLLAIENEQQEGEKACALPWPKLRVLELTATPRSGGQAFPDEAGRKANEDNAVVRQRIHAAKVLTLHSCPDEKKISEGIVKLANEHASSGLAILIFVRKVDDLDKLVKSLPDGSVAQLTGTLRGFEREGLLAKPVFQRFLPESNRAKDVAPQSGTVYLVCTSAGEVGVNISADHLICDLSTFDSMAQRFGRVNRFGDCKGTRIDVAHPNAFDAGNDLDERRERTLRLLEKLNGNASPAALGGLNAAERVAAFAPPPTVLPVTDILFDAWTLTSIRERLPGRPHVEPYLHGLTAWEPPQTKVAWRQEVAWLRPAEDEERSLRDLARLAADILEDYPLKPLELLSDQTDRVFKALKDLQADPKLPVWLVDDEGVVEITTLGELKEQARESLQYLTVVLPPQAGGLANGRLDGKKPYHLDDEPYDVADECRVEVEKVPQLLRKREHNDKTPPVGMRLERTLELPSSTDDEPDTWYFFVRPGTADASARATHSYPLAEHLQDARTLARAMVERLGMPADLARAVELAAAFHDLGKDRRRWQQSIGNSNFPQEKWAKSGHWQAAAERSRYRHEFGSLLDVTAQAEFQALPPEMQDLTLHLIAAHHGRARPHFAEEEAFDLEPRGRDSSPVASATPQRFARLQRRYGRWGLAYLESLVRAADIAASKKAEESQPKEGGKP